MKSDFDEIRNNLNKLALAQLKNEEAIDRLTANQAKTDAQIAKTDAAIDRLTANQAKTDAQIAKTDAAIDRLTANQAKTDAQIAKTDAAIDRLTANQAKTDAQIAKTDAAIDRLTANQAKTDAQIAKTEVLLAKTIKKIDAIAVQMGDLGHSNGEHAEAMFYEALVREKTLGSIKYDSIEKNRKKRRHRTEDEFDIFLENGSSVGIVEVKYKVQKTHIDKILDQKQKNFRIIFPEMKDFKLYMGIAGLSFEPESEEYAMDNGLVVLKQQGKVVQINASQMRAF